MIILKSEYISKERLVIDLTGPEGNAFYLLGQARSLAKQLDYSQEETDTLLDKMKESDYDNLLKVFDEHFGDYIVLLK